MVTFMTVRSLKFIWACCNCFLYCKYRRKWKITFMLHFPELSYKVCYINIFPVFCVVISKVNTNTIVASFRGVSNNIIKKVHMASIRKPTTIPPFKIRIHSFLRSAENRNFLNFHLEYSKRLSTTFALHYSVGSALINPPTLVDFDKVVNSMSAMGRWNVVACEVLNHVIFIAARDVYAWTRQPLRLYCGSVATSDTLLYFK
jgi:hypothetical protein